MYTKWFNNQKSELLDLFDTKPEESLLLETDTIQNNQEDPNRNSFDDFFGIDTSVAKPLNDSTDGIEAKSDAPLKPNFILGPVEQKSNPQSVPLKVRHFRLSSTATLLLYFEYHFHNNVKQFKVFVGIPLIEIR